MKTFDEVREGMNYPSKAEEVFGVNRRILQDLRDMSSALFSYSRELPDDGTFSTERKAMMQIGTRLQNQWKALDKVNKKLEKKK